MTDSASDTAIAREYGDRTLKALLEIVRLTEIGTRLAGRGHTWFTTDPENVPGLAAEGLITKVGENVSRVSPEFAADHRQVPWRVIKDMSNRLTHYYETTDYEVVWATVARDFTEVNAMNRQLLGRPGEP